MIINLRRFNIIKATIYLIIILNLNVFYLVDNSIIPISDLAFLLELVFNVYVLFKYKTKVKYEYLFLILMTIIFVITSSVMAHINYLGQPLFLGIRSQRHWLMAMMMYFPFTKLLKANKISSEELFRIVDNISIIYGSIVIAQFIVGNNFIFLHVQNNTRYGAIRLYVNSSFLFVAFFYHFNKLLNGEKMYLRNLSLLFIPVFILMLVTKSRMRIVAFLASVLIMVFSRKLTKRILILLVFMLIFGCVFVGSDAGQDILNMMAGNASQYQDTSEIRDIGRSYYIESNTKNIYNFLFGTGYPNILWPPAARVSGFDNAIGANDNGVFGLFFCYGFSFVVWLALFSYKLIRNSLKAGTDNIAYYIIYGLLGCYTLFPNIYVTDISFAILCSISDALIKDKQNLHTLA